MAKNAYPSFSPVSTYKHPIMGKVEVYDFTDAKRGAPMSDGNGVQTDFFRNGAEVNNPKQYGIKLFSTSIEAFAAFQRQRLAAKIKAAPPVGCMVQWKVGRWSRWGYKTCIADTSSYLMVNLLCHTGAMAKYIEWARWAGVADKSVQENWKQFKVDSDHSLIWQRDEKGDIRRGKRGEWMMRSKADLRADKRIVEHAGGGFSARFAIDNFEPEAKGSILLKKLKSVNLTGTQYDNLWEIHDDGTFTFERDPRLELGSNWIKSDRATMGNDLHTGNVGVWRGHAVCIDFGFHCVLSNLMDRSIF